MKHIEKKEIVSIPNLMGYFRILLIPFFCYFYLQNWNKGESVGYWIAVGTLAVSTLTDFLDGKVARRFHMETNLGKVLDPVADKLTHGVVAICLAVKYPYMWVLLFIMLIKEGYMLIMNIKVLKQGKFMGGARWYGKLCTGNLFVMLILLIILPEMWNYIANMLITLNICIMIYTWIRYVIMFEKLRKEENCV